MTRRAMMPIKSIHHVTTMNVGVLVLDTVSVFSISFNRWHDNIGEPVGLASQVIPSPNADHFLCTYLPQAQIMVVPILGAIRGIDLVV